jgi:bifunctional non-homologous end joining protein LigD
MPQWLEPMAATLTQERFTGNEWLFERKFDGIRLLAYKRATTSSSIRATACLRTCRRSQAAIARLPVEELILDGEVTWDRHSGYHVFDVLWLNGHNVTSLPLEDRRALLQELPSRRRCAGSSCWTTPNRGSARGARVGRA